MYIHGCGLVFGRKGIIETGFPLRPVAILARPMSPFQIQRFPAESTAISEYPVEGPFGVESFNRPTLTTLAERVKMGSERTERIPNAPLSTERTLTARAANPARNLLIGLDRSMPRNRAPRTSAIRCLP